VGAPFSPWSETGENGASASPDGQRPDFEGLADGLETPGNQRNTRVKEMLPLQGVLPNPSGVLPSVGDFSSWDR